MARGILNQVINILLLALLSSSAFANIGSITEFKGGGNIKRGQATSAASKDSGVEKNDVVSTNSEGKFKISFVDKTTVNITENSKLVIDDFVFDGGGASKGKLALKVALGTVKYTSGDIAHGNPAGVGIKTPTATIAVRGTDFVMSVDEIGRSTVVLVPECFNDKDVTRINFDCPSGQIDVITAAGVVTLSKPFQATMVENTFAPPAPPVIVNPALKNMNNSIQIAPLQTDDGQSLLKAARDSLKKYVDPAKAAADDNKEPSIGTKESTEQVIAATQLREATQAELEQVYKEFNGTKPKTTVYTNVSPSYYKLVQVGWVYARLSEDRLQAVGVWLPKDTQVEVISVQNGISDGYDFVDHKWTTTGTGRAHGHIVINQQGAPR